MLNKCLWLFLLLLLSPPSLLSASCEEVFSLVHEGFRVRIKWDFKWVVSRQWEVGAWSSCTKRSKLYIQFGHNPYRRMSELRELIYFLRHQVSERSRFPRIKLWWHPPSEKIKGSSEKENMSITRESGNVGNENKGERISKISSHYPEPGELINVPIESPKWQTDGRRRHYSRVPNTGHTWGAVFWGQTCRISTDQSREDAKKNMLYKQ